MHRSPINISLRAVLLVTTILSLPAAAQAADAAGKWSDTIAFSGHAEAGIAFNPAAPGNDENVGSLMTDRANQVEMNQLFLTVERPIDSSSNKFDIGFRLQGNFGTDARYTHSLAETDHLIHSRYQFDVNEASVSMHLPTKMSFLDSVDLKLGQIPSPFSAEVIDATQNQLYSHSYIFNFGVPAKSTGALATAHVNPMLDIYAGFDTGVNGGIDSRGDNNGNIKAQFGFGLNNLADGKLSVVALTHMGTENPTNYGLPHTMRYLNDITATYKANDKWTFVTDVNYAQEDVTNSTAYGLAQYATYTLNDNVSFTARGEMFRDNGGWVVVNPGYFDSANGQRGLPVSAGQYVGPHTTYGEFTLGMNWKPGFVPKAIAGTVVRPELRVDHSFNDSKPFNSSSTSLGDNTSFTPAVDVVVPF
ncbi:MAG: outer membrane beta-barrel protein [Alphaproteobacteria bacterium]|nr:outer membrane beta-barrel protein [Alphaproteobacteria bacterium]